jgi:hypothetical protein
MPDIKFIKPLIAVPKVKTNIYALKPPAATAKAVADFAKRFGLESAKAVRSQDPDKFTYKAGQHIVSLFKASGALRYQDATRWQVDDGKTHIDVPDADAQKLALAAIKRHNLAPSADFKLLKVTRLTVGESGPETKKATSRAVDLGVCFQRTVGGVPVDGPGGKLVVYLDHKGELTGFDRIWRPIKAVQSPVKALQPPTMIEPSLARYWSLHEAGLLQVDEVRFGYFEFGYNDKQTVLQPAYVSLITLVGGDPKQPIRVRTVHVMPAATNAVGELMPPPKTVVPQPRRG